MHASIVASRDAPARGDVNGEGVGPPSGPDSGPRSENDARRPFPARPVLFSLAYFLCAWAGQALTSESSPAASFWPPSGLFLAALLRCERSRWPVLVLAALPANLLFDLLNHRSALASAGFFLGNSLEALGGAWLVETALGGRLRRLGFRQTVALVLCGGLLAPALGAAAGAGVLALTGQAASYFLAWRTWWSADMLGVVVVAPLLLAWDAGLAGRVRAARPARIAECAAMLACVAAFGWLTFGRPLEQGFMFRYALVMALCWAALRFGRAGVASAGALAVAVSVYLVVNGHNDSPLLEMPRESQVVGLHLFFGSLMASLLALSAAVAERVAAVDALRASEAHYRDLFEHSLAPIAEVDSGGLLTRVNPAFCAFRGEPRESLAGVRLLQDCVHPGDIPRSRELMQALASRAVDHFIQEKRYLTASGQAVDAMAFVRGRYGAQGGFEGAVVSLMDISGRKRLEESLRASLREKEVLLREIHHRVKNNLQIIVSLLSLQEQGVRDRAALDVLSDSRGRVMSMAMVHEQLYRSREMSGVGLEEYLREFLPRLAALHGGERAVALDLESAPVRLSLDQAIPFGLVVNELATNAFKHGLAGRPRGHLSVRVAVAAGEVSVAVEDDGPGLPPGFSPECAQTLGLRIGGMLAEQLGGVLELESRVPARFRLRFPLKEAAPGGPGSPPRQA